MAVARLVSTVAPTPVPNPKPNPTQLCSSLSWVAATNSSTIRSQFPSSFIGQRRHQHSYSILTCLSSPTPPPSAAPRKTRLYVSGLSFRTTEETLRNAFQNYGQLVEVNLVMDKIANRPRGFAFLRYATEEESQKAIEGMHGKFLDGRVIFVEVAKSRSELRNANKNNQ